MGKNEEGMNLKSIVQTNMSTARSINLNRDYQQKELIDDYHITVKTTEILNRFADSLEGEKVSAWSLTGPYGMGKSAFVNFLLSLAGPSSDSVTKLALKKVRSVDPYLFKRLHSSMTNRADGTGFLRIPVTAAYEPINNSLARGLLSLIKALSFNQKNKIQTALEKMLENKAVESSALFTLFSEIQKQFPAPMMIVVDEFGKNLDYMSTHHDKGDIFIMQQLAEMNSVYLWVCLHQSFEDYASGLSTLQRREWSKVQGRFEDISFVESTSQMLYLMKRALKYNSKGEYKTRLIKWAKDASDLIAVTDINAKKFLTLENILSIYPLHPVTAVALIELCTRFAQNDRTLLTFMCSNDRLALPTFLEITNIGSQDTLPAVGLDYLYDYFFDVSAATYINRAASQQWIEIHNIINSRADFSNTEITVLKTIGVLNLLSGSTGLKAAPKTVSNVIEQTSGIDKQITDKDLNSLINRGILHYREFADEYRLWEGSDFNVQKAINDARSKLEIGELDLILQKYLPLHPVIASRHSYKTGTIRRFERKWLSEELLNENLTPQDGFDGLLFYCFGSLKKPSIVPEICADGKPLVIAYVSSQTTLKELALDVAAIRTVLSDSIELRHDSVARKEIKFRYKSARDNFRLYLEQLFAPGSDKVSWYVNGEEKRITSTKELSSILSSLCDSCYHGCPPVKNEMVSYEKLSGASSRARRVLIEAMFTSEKEENLGLQGFGPEVAMYKSLLRREGLHIKDEQTGHWQFSLGSGKVNKYLALWNGIDWLLNEAKDGISVEEILSSLKAPPFGLRQGPAPIYISLYTIVHSESVAVFQEGTYRPYLSAAEAALMIKRPDLFTLKKYIFTDVDRAVFSAYKNILKAVHVEGKPGLRNENLISIVGPLVHFVESLPDFTKNTRQVTPEARQVRLAIQNSRDPALLIFEELPKAVGITIDDKDAILENKFFQEKLYAALNELSQAFPGLLDKIYETMLNVFKCDGIEHLMESKCRRVEPLINICDDGKVKQVLKTMNRKVVEAAEWVKGLASLIMGKPIESWGDHDFTILEARLYDYADKINYLETLASIKDEYSQRKSRVISMMMPDGSIKRKVIGGSTPNKEVGKEASRMIRDNPERALALFTALAEGLLGGDGDGAQ